MIAEQPVYVHLLSYVSNGGRRGSLELIRPYITRLNGGKPVAFAKGTYGKPETETGRPRFNLSHSGERLLLAVTEAVPVGADIELKKKKREYRVIARRFFSPEENRWIVAADTESEAEDRFYSLWCLHEAYGKALGGGVLRDRIPSDAAVGCGFGWRQAGEWWITRLRLPRHETEAGYYAALCARKPLVPVFYVEA